MDDKIFGQVEILTGLVGNLQNSVGSLNSTANIFATSVQDLTAVIGNAEKGVGSFNRGLSDQQNAFNSLSAAADDASESIDAYSKIITAKTEAVQKDLAKRYGSLVDSNVSITRAGLNKLTFGYMDYAKQQREIFSNLENGRERFFFAFDMFRSHFKFFASIGTSIFKIFKGLMTTLISVGKLIITLPLKTLETLLDIAHSIREEYLAISQTLEDTQENFSSTSKQGQGFVRLTSQIRGLGGAFLNVNSEAARTFGYGLQGQQAMAAAVKETVTAMGSLGNLYSDAYQDNAIYAERAIKSLSMTTEDNMFLMRKSMSQGIHPFQGLAKAIYASNEAQKKFGIDQKQVAKGMNVLRKNVIEFSHLSEQEFANITAKAAQLGVEAEGLVAIFNKFTTFESAAESAALLSQTFGMAIDAMDIIRAEDPLEILNQFREGMMQTGRDFNDLNRHEKALLSQYTGLNGEMLQTAMSFEGIGLSYSELQQKMKESSPENLLKEAVKEMSGSIKEFMNVGKKLTSPFQAMTEGMKDALVKNSHFQRSMMGLSNSIQNIYTKVLNKFLSKDLLDSIDNIVTTFSKLIDDDVANGFVTISQNLGKFISVLINANSTASQITESFDNLYDSVIKSKFVSRLIEIGKRMVGGIISGFVKSLPALITGFTDLLKLFNGAISGQSYDNPQTGLGKFFKEYIFDSWDQVKGVLVDKKNSKGDVISKGLISNLIDELRLAISNSSSFFIEIGKMIASFIWEGVKALWNESSLTTKLLAGGALALPIATTALTLYAGKKLLGGALSGGASALTGEALHNQQIATQLQGTTGLSNSTQKALAASQAGEKLSVGQAGLINAAKAGNTTMRGVSAAKWSALAGRGAAAASIGSRLLTGGNVLLSGAMVGKDIYDIFDESQANKKGENIGGAAGGIILGGIGAVFGGPVGAAIGATVGNTLGNWIGSFWDEEESKSEQAQKQRQSQEQQIREEQKRQQEIRDTEITQAVSQMNNQPIVINLSIKQSLDGNELTNRILSAALNGTTQFNINTDDAGRMQLLSKNANDAGGYNPVPQA